MSTINVTEESDFEGKKISVNNLNVLPIFTKKWFERIETFVKEDNESYAIYKLIPENTNFQGVLNIHDAYLFIIHKDNKVFVRDIGGLFPVTPNFLSFIELVTSD